MKKFAFIAIMILLSEYSQNSSASEISLDFCHIENFSEEVLCGSYQVEENRNQPNGRVLDIQVAVLPSVSEAKEPDPLVLFSGGPGQGARAMGNFINMAFREVNETRDIILIDQRGMGDSSPLSCEIPEMDFSSMDSAEMNALYQKVIKDCAAEIDADVTQYTQDIANQDIHEILVALGYDKVNLYGVSWGTRSALLYANQFPEQVRTVTLDGTAPLANKVPLFFTRDAQKTMNLLLQDCSQDEKCAATFVDLEQRFNQFMDNYPEEGISIRIADPNTGKMAETSIGKDMVISAIRTILYSPDMTRMLPLAIEKMIDNDFRPLAGILAAAGDAGMTIGATLTILCSEEYARFSESEIKASEADGFEAGTFIKNLAESCDLWPKAPLPEIYSQKLEQPVATLILSGALDPVTPPYWGEEMRTHFPNSRHLVAPNTGHNVAPVGCADDLIAEFINSTDYAALDDSCLQEVQRPTFFLNSSGPVARTSK